MDEKQEEKLVPEGVPGLETLFARYYQRLCYFAFKMTEEKEAAEDIVQDSFVKYWHRQDQFDNEQAAKTFLYITVRNACLNRIRHSGVQKKYAQSQQGSGLEESAGLDQIIRAEVIGEIHRAIEELPPGCRQVLKLAFFENMKNDEIAQELSVSINTVKTQKARALQILRLKLDSGTYLLLLLLLRQV